MLFASFIREHHLKFIHINKGQQNEISGDIFLNQETRQKGIISQKKNCT